MQPGEIKVRIFKSKAPYSNVKRRIIMPKFYFTYGTDPAFPFQGGWTEIEAPDWFTANKIFQAYRHNRSVGTYNYADSYSEEEFLGSDMMATGNFGAYCHERIVVSRKISTLETQTSAALSKGDSYTHED